MNRVLLIVILFVILIPIVWRIALSIVMKIENKVNSPGIDVDKLNEQRKSMIEELNQRKQQAEDEATSAQEALKKLK